MTTTVTLYETTAVANGVAPIPFTFQALSANELAVYRNNVLQTKDVHYSVALSGDGTGSITPLASWGTDPVIIRSNPNFQQTANFTRFGPLYPDQLNPLLDRQTRYSIWLWQTLTKAITQEAADISTVGGEITALQATDTAMAAALAALDLRLDTIDVTLTSFRPEDYGAKPDDPTFDNGPALAAMSTAINAAGGGKAIFKRGAVYWIGAQTGILSGTYQFPPVTQYPVNIVGCTRPVLIDLNGAVLKTRAGLKYGTFNANGTVLTTVAHGMPYYGNSAAVPFYNAINIDGNSGGVRVFDGELDGNIGALTIGGQWGDTGWQLPHSGIRINNNTCPVTFENVYSHHFSLDGGTSSWPGLDAAHVEQYHYPVILRNCQFLFNGRQGWSLVGGSGFYAYNCDFSHTGKNGVIGSSPSAGIDLEAEGSIVRKVRFYDCSFVDNAGVGQLTVGDVENVESYSSTYIGTTSWSVWPQGKRHRFYSCQFTGSMVNAQGSTTNPNDAVQFHFCKFLHGLSRSPTGTVYNNFGGSNTMCDFGGADDTNVLFNGCAFDVENHPSMTLPYTGNSIYRNCFQKINTATNSYPRGVYEGHNKIVATGGAFVDLNGAINLGEIDTAGTTGTVVSLVTQIRNNTRVIGELQISGASGTTRYLKYQTAGVDSGAYIALGGDNVSLFYNIPTAGLHTFQINGATAASIAAGQTRIFGETAIDFQGLFFNGPSWWAGAFGGNGNGRLFATAAGGTQIYGQGSAYDISIGNKIGTIAIRIPTNTANAEVVGILSAASVAATGTVTGSNLSGTNTGDGAYVVQTKTTGYTATENAGDVIVLCNLAAGFTVVLPTAVGNKARFTFKKLAAAGQIIIDGAGSETIDGALTATLNAQYESITIVSDNANWMIV
jgi:hypothetical protein